MMVYYQYFGREKTRELSSSYQRADQQGLDPEPDGRRIRLRPEQYCATFEGRRRTTQVRHRGSPGAHEQVQGPQVLHAGDDVKGICDMCLKAGELHTYRIEGVVMNMHPKCKKDFDQSHGRNVKPKRSLKDRLRGK